MRGNRSQFSIAILVIGATGKFGRQVVEHLVTRGEDERALARDPSKATFSDGVSVVQGDFLDVDLLRNAMYGVSTLFLLDVVVPDGFTQALMALNVSRSAGFERIV